jgi:phage terminase small subunit
MAFKMSKEQKRLFDALTTLQQEVCLNSLSGMNDSDSYRNSSGKAISEDTMRVVVSKMLTNANVIAFMDSMKETKVSSAIMSRERMMELLTKISDIDALALAQLSPEELTEVKGGFDVKLKAMKQLSELAGYDAPKQLEVTSKEELTPWDDLDAGIDG